MRQGAVLFFLLFLNPVFAEHLPFQQVLSTEIGPRSQNPIRNMNINRFDESRKSQERVNCQSYDYARVCPENMVFVCSEHFRIAVCVDRDLHNDSHTGRPQGNMNLYACQQTCARQNKRIPTNNEWQVACTGTQPYECLTYYRNGGTYPPEYFARIPGHPCNPNSGIPGAGPYNHLCMTHPDLINALPPVSNQCVSEAGVRGCVGTFHQWVSHHFVGAGENQGFRFNGGSYVVTASAVDYVTPAHTNDFFHYANGCRCAANPGR